MTNAMLVVDTIRMNNSKADAVALRNAFIDEIRRKKLSEAEATQGFNYIDDLISSRAITNSRKPLTITERLAKCSTLEDFIDVNRSINLLQEGSHQRNVYEAMIRNNETLSNLQNQAEELMPKYKQLTKVAETTVPQLTITERLAKCSTQEEFNEIKKSIEALEEGSHQRNVYEAMIKNDEKLAVFQNKAAKVAETTVPQLTITERLAECSTQEEFNQIKKSIEALEEGSHQRNVYEAMIKNDEKLTGFQASYTTATGCDKFTGKFNTTIDIADNKQVVQNAAETASETMAKQGEKAGETIVDTVKEEGKKVLEEGKEAAKKMPTWGWVAIGAGALIALLAGVSAHNKNKQQQQLNAVA